MNQRAKESGARELLEMRAGFRQASTDAFDRADREPAPHEWVQLDPAGHDVAARLVPGQVDRLEDLASMSASW
jgi:hypothetical protein